MSDPLGGCRVAPKMYVNEPRYLCGFYFHLSTGGYRLLARVCGIGFKVHTLGTNSWRGINASTHNPTSCTVDHSLEVHGNLHWVGTEGIIVFDMDSEEFSQMAYPAECNAWYQNHIMIMAHNLGLCKVTPQTRLEIWILKDHSRKLWIKQYAISMHSFMNYTALDFQLLKVCFCATIIENIKTVLFSTMLNTMHSRNLTSKVRLIGGVAKLLVCPLVINFDKGKRSLI